MPDFFAFSKVLPLFFYPLPFFLFFLFVLSFGFKKGTSRLVLRLSLIGFWVISTPWFANVALSIWEEPRKVRSELAPVYDAAVVLGGLSDPLVSTSEHLEFNKSVERLTEAIQLYREGRVKKILITSGPGDLLNQASPEAPPLGHFALQNGVKAEDLLEEDRSRNTHENSQFSKPLLQKAGVKTVLLITSAYHMKRAYAVFLKDGYNRDGMKLTSWPVDTGRESQGFPFNAVPDGESVQIVQTLVKEVVGFLAYAFQGYL